MIELTKVSNLSIITDIDATWPDPRQGLLAWSSLLGGSNAQQQQLEISRHGSGMIFGCAEWTDLPEHCLQAQTVYTSHLHVRDLCQMLFSEADKKKANLCQLQFQLDHNSISAGRVSI